MTNTEHTKPKAKTCQDSVASLGGGNALLPYEKRFTICFIKPMNPKLLQFLAACSILTLVGCSNSSSYSGRYEESTYEAEQGNPYDDGSGHDAGYKWAERTGGDCNGNSASFNEGCEEYHLQQGE